MKLLIIWGIMFLNAMICSAQDKPSLSAEGAAGDGVQAGWLLEIPFAGYYEFMNEFAANTVHGTSDTVTGLFWFNDHIAAQGGFDLENPHNAFVGPAFSGKHWNTYTGYYPRSRGATITQEFEVHPKLWLGFYGGYLDNQPTASVTIRYELWRKK